LPSWTQTAYGALYCQRRDSCQGERSQDTLPAPPQIGPSGYHAGGKHAAADRKKYLGLPTAPENFGESIAV